MKNYKVEVSKGLEKFTFIRKAETELDLREELHEEKFTILSVLSIEDVEIAGAKFFFEIEDKGKIRVGTIASNDIFKSYLKIKSELGYNLVSLYQDKETSDEEKKRIMHDLNEQYKIYLESNKKKIKEKEVEDDKTKKVVIVEENVDNFHMKKELQEVYKVLDRVLEKMKFFLEGSEFDSTIGFERKSKLQETYYAILKIRTSSNVVKLRTIGEMGLKKVGEIELEILESQKDFQYRVYVKETNELLKKLKSRDSFIEKEKDIRYIAQKIFTNIQAFLSGKMVKKKKVEVDMASASFLRTKLLHNNYKSKLKMLDQEIAKNIIIYIIPTQKNAEKKIEYTLRRKVLKQNLMVLKARMSGKTFSLTKIVKGYKYFAEKFVSFLGFFQIPFVIITVSYSIIFLFIQTSVYLGIMERTFNFYGLLYFLYINFAFILLQYTKGLGSFIFNIVILMFLFRVGVINF